METLEIIGEATETVSTGKKERRRSRRFACGELAEGMAFQPEVLFRGQVLDISELGCFVETKARLRLEPGVQVALRFTLSGCPFSTLARVRDVRPGKGVALEFQFVNEHAGELFKQVIQMLSARESQREI